MTLVTLLPLGSNLWFVFNASATTSRFSVLKFGTDIILFQLRITTVQYFGFEKNKINQNSHKLDAPLK